MAIKRNDLKKLSMAVFPIITAGAIVGKHYYDKRSNRLKDEPPSQAETQINELRKQDPISNTERGYSLILQAYNAGPGNLLKYKGNVPFNETRNYVNRVLSYMRTGNTTTNYTNIIERESSKRRVAPALVASVVKVESSGNPNAVSRVGATGLMQITKPTWDDMTKNLGVNWEYEKYAKDPEKNIIVGVAYITWLRDRIVVPNRHRFVA